MVLAGKVFKIKEETDLTSISAKLKGYKHEEEYSYGDQIVPLVKEIGNLVLTSESLAGIFSQDIVFTVPHREGEKLVVKTMNAPFLFAKDGKMVYLVILEKKRVANNMANQLSKICFMGAGSIVEAKIAPATLKKYHEANPEDTKVIFFDGVDIPNIEKLSLYGSGLADTILYGEYASRGAIWYMVFKSRRYGIVVGVTRSAVVTAFSEIKEEEFLTFIREEIFPLIE
jgi:hypothetical protein